MTRTLLDFESLNEGVVVTNQFVTAGRGVSMNGPVARALPSRPHSGRIYLRKETGYAEFDTRRIFEAVFHGLPAERVSFRAGAEGPGGAVVFGILRAFDNVGNEYLQDGPKELEVGACKTRFECRRWINAFPPLRVHRVRLELFGFHGGNLFDPDPIVDDFEYEMPDVLRVSIPRMPPRFGWDPLLHAIESGPLPEWRRSHMAAGLLSTAMDEVAGEVQTGLKKLVAKQSDIARRLFEAEARKAGRRRAT